MTTEANPKMLAEKLIFGRLGKPDTKFVRADTGEYVCTYRESETTFAGRRLILRFTIRPAPAETTMAVFEAVDGFWLNPSERRLLWKFSPDPIKGEIGPSWFPKDITQTAQLDLDEAVYCPVKIPEWGKFSELTQDGEYYWTANGQPSGRGKFTWSLKWEAFNVRLRCDDHYIDNAHYDRVEYFDSNGLAGFIDASAVDWNGVVVREDLYVPTSR